jgi:hypothetical protein
MWRSTRDKNHYIFINLFYGLGITYTKSESGRCWSLFYAKELMILDESNGWDK